MTTLKSKWYVIAFNLVALAIMLPLLIPAVESQAIFTSLGSGYGQMRMDQIASPNFRLAGTWAIRFLVISLAISPMVYLLGWRKLVPLRKWAGLWAFGFAGLHVLMFFGDYMWGKVWGREAFTYVGAVAMIILLVLALTSHRWAMRWLGRNWKRLHRLVYVAAVLVVIHAINGILFWQKIPRIDQVITEMQFYGLVIGVLLILRIPQARQLLRTAFKLPKQKREKIKNMA